MVDNRTETQRLHDKFSTVKALYGESNNEIQRNRDYYDRRFADEIVPPQWRSRLTTLIPQTARRAIDEPADHILTFPYIKVPVRPTENDSVKEEVRAEIVRQAMTAWWGTVSRTFNTVGDARKPLLNEGKVAVRKTIRWDLVPTYPTKKNRSAPQFEKAVRKYREEIDRLGRSAFLWDIQLLDNITVFEDPSDHRDPTYVFVSYRIFTEDARRRWPDAAGKWKENDDLDMVTYTEYWSKPGPCKPDKTWEPGKFIQWVEDECVHDADNPYPYLPIVIDNAGFGLNHHLAKPEEIYVGMTQHAREMFRAQAESMTSWLAVERLAAFPIGKSRNLPDDKQLNIGPGEVINFEGDENVPGSEDLEWMTHPDVPQGVVALVEQIEREANSTFKMDVLGGMPQRGVDTATEADLNIRNAVSKLSGPIAALERVVAKITRQVLMDVELVLRAPVTLYGTNKSSTTPAEILLKPTDINGYYEVYAQLTTADQEVMEQTKARFWLEAQQRSPGLSLQTALERGNVVDDPISEFIRRLSENTLFSPQMEHMRVMAAAADLGMQLQQVQAEQAGQGDETSLLGPTADATMNGTMETTMGATQANVTQDAYRNRDANVVGF